MLQAKPAKPPVKIDRWCNLDPAKEPPMPVDVSKCSCDDPVEISRGRKWSRQHPGIDIVGYDGISDNGEEVFNFCEQEGITNIVIMGVHTNMCVLGRPFGLRQMAKNGKHVVLMRDMTDTMYNPARWPNVSHFRGTDLIVEHIEKFVCPTVTSDQILGGKPFRFKNDVSP
jgi:hypothetical protein